MTARIIHQRTGVTVAVFDTYEEAGRYRAELRTDVRKNCLRCIDISLLSNARRGVAGISHPEPCSRHTRHESPSTKGTRSE